MQPNFSCQSYFRISIETISLIQSSDIFAKDIFSFLIGSYLTK